MPLRNVIENNSWSVDLLAVEVAGGGYCSRSVLWCFTNLGLRKRTIKTTIKQVSVQLNAPFVSGWPEAIRHGPLKKLTFFKKTPEDPLIHQKTLSTLFKANSLKINLSFQVGFISKGNTCYANAIPQTLSVLPSPWDRVSSESSTRWWHLHFWNQLLWTWK